MPIQDSDLLLIETTSGVSNKIEASKLKANLAANTYNNYKLLVNKPDYSSRFVYAQNLQASVGTTDYMLVERAGVSYKVNGQQIIDYFPSVPAGAAGPITDVTGAGVSVYQTDTIASVDAANDWNQSEIWSNDAGLIGPGLVDYAKAFDGNTRSSAYLNGQSSTGYTFTIPDSLKPVTSFAAYTAQVSSMILTGDTTYTFAATTSNDVLNEIDPSYIPNNLSKVQFTGPNTNIYLNALIVNGKMLVDTGISGDPKTSSLLTFPTNNNLDKFKVGDVVQTEVNGSPFTADFSSNLFYADAASPASEVPIKTSTVATNSANAFNGNSTGAPANGVPKFGDGYWLDIPIPFKASQIEFRTTTGGTQYKLRAKVYDDAGGEVDFYVDNQPNNPVWYAINTQSLTGNVTDIVMWLENNGMTFWAIQAVSEGTNHVLIDGSSTATNVQVVSTDTAANTMSVDGGAWLGADGSGDAGGDTVVTKTAAYDSQLTLASDANLDTFTIGDAINMVDSDGDVASYTPVTSTIASVGSALNVLSTTNPGGSDWNNPSPGTSNKSYTQTFTGFTPATSFTATDAGSSYVFDFGAVVSWEFDKGASSNPTFYASNDNITYTYCGNTNANGTLSSDGANNYSAAINGSKFSGVSRYVVTYSGGTGYTLDQVGVTLTFASPNKDLKYFNPGDVVQGSLIPSQIYSANPGNDWIGYGGGSTYGVEQAFTGSTSNNAQSQQPRATIAFTNFPVGKVGLIVDSGAIDDPVVFYEINGTPINSSNTTSSSWITGGKILYEFNTEVALTSIVQVSSNSSSSKALYGITINGDILIDGQPVDSNSVQVISTDIAANTMVVNGGAWRGSDGSDSGLGFFSMSLKNPAGDVLEYELTAPTIVRAPNYNIYNDKIVIETITANSAGTLDLNLHSTSGDSTYVITLNGGTTTTSPLSGTLKAAIDSLAQFVFANAGDSIEIEYTFLGTGTGASATHALHYANDPGSNRKVQWNGTNVLFDGTDQNVEINGVLPGGGSGPAETEVTGTAMSGTGNFLSNTGPVVDVSNSNQQWVDNDNRLGESFFIKSASTRTGLAILRTKAIAQAQAWATKIAYEEQSFVTYKGHYWVSKSETPSSRPSGKSEEWIDLGPVKEG